ncbi:S-adenosylmethionine decarboxylase [Psychromonas sp. Urea-02u-13]|uniref:S-adenosylmethionine decarboxylase n=1 Tax=Psychromonas sp. Urea-02u-13 TaxID=2058326 RepID=UPI000C33F41A|nr:S-adenosylmethionine decarboxylase [Psychromonas sp. Urea-02u-13]PKG40603.1 S-adenosylmethionine decarboxylase [Psychromonas sp. Urea-02u-13]
MFYEGSEKRLEITSTLNLLEFDEDFWQEMVKQAGAFIISKIENEQIKAFLLSESSLFVWKNRLLLITCGETHLLQAALFFQKAVQRQEITSLLFQRHQAHYPERQKSSFQQDSLQLQNKLKGNSQHWSKGYCGDIFLFGNNQQANPTKNIFMLHELGSVFFEELQKGKVDTSRVAKQLKLTSYFNGFSIDQYSFEPKGYSLNAIDGERYFTLHITPEKLSSYISFESNLSAHEVSVFQQHLSVLFQPQRAYLMLFNATKQKLNIETRQVTTQAVAI